MADTDTPQTPAQDTGTPPAFDVRLPEGVTLDPQVIDRWQAQFRAANLEQSHVDAIVQWHYRLQEPVQEQALMRPHERAEMETQRKALTAKRFAGGLSATEERTLRGIYERMAQEGRQ